MSDIRVRMAPSPTGLFHIGSARTTLFNYLFARHYGGKFVLRIEDTDAARSTKENEEDILRCIRWLGLDYDEGPGKDGPYGPYYQTQRLDLYKKHAEQLLAEGKAYYCYCTPEELDAERQEMMKNKQPPKYSGKCRHLTAEQRAQYEREGRNKVLRFPMPAETVTYHDLIKGDITVDASLMGDLVIMKGDGIAMYNFANIIDDHFMQISHVIRGEDHISNTPKQILIYRAFGWDVPQMGHIPLILNPDRSKMSKRSGPTSVTQYKNEGYLPEAIINFLALLGWSPGDDRELFDLDSLAEAFTIEHVQSSPAVFNIDKLLWFNGHYIRAAGKDLTAELEPYWREVVGDRYDEPETRAYIKSIVPLVFERLAKLGDLPQFVHFFFADTLPLTPELLKPAKREVSDCVAPLDMTIADLTALATWEPEAIEECLRGVVEKTGWKVGEIFMMVRIAVTGEKATPPLTDTMKVLGRDRVMARLTAARDVMQG